MKAKIEQLIEKRENTLMNYTISSMGEMVIKDFLKDLESLQETTEGKCFYCEENKCNCEQQELIERHIADDATDDVERICPHCGYSTIPFKVNKQNEPLGDKIIHEGDYKKSMGIVD